MACKGEIYMDTCLPNKVYVVIIALLVIMGFIVTGKESIAVSTPLKSGEYLSRRYIEQLRKTQSPLASEGDRTINLLVVEKKEDGIGVLPIMHFHEGGPSFRLNQSNKLELEDNAGLEVSYYQMGILSSKEISFSFNQFPVDKFVYVNNVQQLLNKECVEGKYVDAKGRLYYFASNGTATTPDGIFRFVVGIDHTPYRFDYLEDSTTHQIYRFIRKKCTLEIYRVLDATENQHGNDGSHIEPLWSLRKINCKTK